MMMEKNKNLLKKKKIVSITLTIGSEAVRYADASCKSSPSLYFRKALTIYWHTKSVGCRAERTALNSSGNVAG